MHSRLFWLLCASGTLHTPTNKLDVERARFVKKNVMQSRVFSNSPRGDPIGAKIWGKEWEDQILGLVDYSLSHVKVHAGARMKGGGGRL